MASVSPTPPEQTSTSVAIVGPGAIGTTIAAALHDAGHAPFLYGRTPRKQLELSKGEDRIVIPGPVQTDPGQVKTPADVVFLSVKATQVEAASPWLTTLCGPQTLVCVLQNGVEQQALLSAYIPPQQVIPAVVWFPAETQPDASVKLRGEPRLSLPNVPGVQRIVTVLRDTWCGVEVSSDFISAAWRKLLRNAVAGLMVLTGRRSGMFRRTDITTLTRAYLHEGLSVARAEGAVLSDDVAEDILGLFQGFPADMGTSILADRQAGRPLEWDVRNGVLQRRGRAHGIPTPISDVLVPLLAAASDGGA